ncbi:uncharacterized protein LOC131243374 [Magnolia sinica]|uniref:uncharacterized protein LOC131243374 n=1 Tax=Magnolia sinica TaxID=86752 RepID=UPI00265836F5|nr:uncharacterized protein LOC131243374 [Magnolia sinica]
MWRGAQNTSLYALRFQGVESFSLCKSEIIQRKFTITKALLFKADKSSFDRLCQQTMYMDGILQFAVCVNGTVLQRSRPLILWAPTFEGHISKTIQMRRPFPTQLDDAVV